MFLKRRSRGEGNSLSVSQEQTYDKQIEYKGS